jgi:hypothetical protein
MGNIYIDIVKEIYARLTAAKATGKRLSDLVRLDFGLREEATGGTDCPAITVDPVSIQEQVQQNRTACLNGTIQVLLQCTYYVNPISGNIYWDASNNDSGVLKFLQAILDTINTKVDGATKDCFLLGTVKEEIRYEVSPFIRRDNNFIDFDILITCISKNFDFNGRSY